MDPTVSALPLATRVRRAALVFAALGVLAGLLYAKAVPCTFARVFHTPCPGCGSTRAVLALLHGDLHDVLYFNAMGPFLAALLGALAVSSILSVFRHGDFREAGSGKLGLIIRRGVFIIVILDLVIWVARFFGFLGGPVPVV